VAGLADPNVAGNRKLGWLTTSQAFSGKLIPPKIFAAILAAHELSPLD
jgi:hypothetical protein